MLVKSSAFFSLSITPAFDLSSYLLQFIMKTILLIFHSLTISPFLPFIEVKVKRLQKSACKFFFVNFFITLSKACSEELYFSLMVATFLFLIAARVKRPRVKARSESMINVGNMKTLKHEN